MKDIFCGSGAVLALFAVLVASGIAEHSDDLAAFGVAFAGCLASFLAFAVSVTIE